MSADMRRSAACNVNVFAIPRCISRCRVMPVMMSKDSEGGFAGKAAAMIIQGHPSMCALNGNRNVSRRHYFVAHARLSDDVKAHRVGRFAEKVHCKLLHKRSCSPHTRFAPCNNASLARNRLHSQTTAFITTMPALKLSFCYNRRAWSP